MGAYLSSFKSAIEGVGLSATGARKRKHSESSDELRCEEQPLKRKKLMTTAQYVYQVMFKEEHKSDVAVRCLGRTWHLHKVYLCQSAYFSSMFGGSWKESDRDFINIEIIDPNISIEALDAVFGSLYLDEITLNKNVIIPVLATSALFQLNSLIEKCSEVMIESIDPITVVAFYEAACQYGVKNVRDAAFEWLQVNFLNYYMKHLKLLNQVNLELMYKLISSPDLFVMQTEYAIYYLLKNWIYFQLHPGTETNPRSDLKAVIQNFYNNLSKSKPFLETRLGKKYEILFRALRLNYLLNHHRDIEIILKDNIIPHDWIYTPILQQWDAMLCFDESTYNGPAECDEKTFGESCMRCGRVLQSEGFQKWRWTGFNFGLDLVFIVDTRNLSIKRNHRPENERLLSLQVKRQFLARVTILTVNENSQVKRRQSSGIKALTLEKNEEVTLLQFDKDLSYPLLISINILTVSPRIPADKIHTKAQVTSGSSSDNPSHLNEVNLSHNDDE
ncbi:protein germ cell-less [Phlebotomus papatasi]|uniref:protein germ cell-less n=1 Tax=Phlebotomus papatasi TaxID=29031 RepID=UPI0024834BF5|nr:protein germ cell-less [Phlebotomus papatasi]